jgi:hypothetical protein
LPGGFDPEATINYFENDGTKRAVILLNTALVLQNACEDAHDCYDRYYWYTVECQRAVTRLNEFLPYFDDLVEGLEDRVSETSRSLSEERALLTQLLNNIQR